MRQSIKAAGLASLLLLSLTDLSAAEPLVKGFFVEKLPANSLSQALAPGKGLVLAHVLNQSNVAINSGSYQIGVEIEDKGNVKTYSLTPKYSITAGALKTFRMAIPVDGIDKTTGQFRVFSRINGVTTWSESYSFLQGIQSSTANNGVTTLYTEAPPISEKTIAPKEVPFESDKAKTASVSNTSKAKSADSILNELSAEAKKTSSKVATKATETKTAATNVAKATTEQAKSTADKTVASVKESVDSAKTKATTVASNVKAEQKKAETKVAEVAKAEKSKVVATATETKASTARKINPSEFKKLRTMDEELIIYVIKDGDTLKSISENYYGTASKERVIADLNFIEKSSSVRVGEEIIVEVRPLDKTSKKG